MRSHVPIFDIMGKCKAIVVFCLAILFSATRAGAQAHIVLDQSFTRAILNAPEEGSAAKAEKVWRRARSGERYLDYVLDNRSNHDDWVLSAFMDADTRIEILEVGEEQPETKTIFSRTLPFRKEASLGGPYAVRLDVPQKSSRQYLIFLSDDRPVQLTLWSGDAYAAHSARRHLLLGLFYGAVLLLVMIQLTASFALRDGSFFWFGLFIFFSAVSLSYWDGVAIETFHPSWLPASESLFYFGFANLSMVFGYFFLHRFADLRKVAPRLGNVVLALAWCQAALTAIVPWARPAFFPWLVAGLGTVHASIQILGGILAARRAARSARLLIAGFALQAAVTFLLFLRALGLSLLERIEFAIALFYPAILASAVFIAVALIRRIRAIDQARDMAETRSNAFGAYFVDLSQELMPPMRLLMASIAANERRSPPSRELASLRRNAEKLNRSMDTLLNAPHPERGIPPPSTGATTDLGAVVRERVSAFSAAAPEDGSGPQVELEPRLLVDMDAATSERIVDRVLGSIMGGGAWNEETRIALRQVRGRVELRAEMSSGECLDGSGIPLAGGSIGTADAFIERGALPGGGSSIRVSLPAATAAAKPSPGLDRGNGPRPWGGPALAYVAPRESEAAAEGENRHFVMILSDQPGLRPGLEARLGDDFRVATAGDAGTALEILASEGEYRVVVVDLPGGIADGHEVLRLVRSESRRAGTAFIIAAASEEREGRREVLAEGSVVLLPKPLDPEETALAAADLSRRGAEIQHRQEDEYRRRLELMLGGLSHAVKNPLSGITGPLALLKRLPNQEFNPEAAKYLSQMEESAGRIGNILRDVRSALFAGPLKSEAIGLDGVLGGIAANIRAAYPQLSLILDPSGGMEIRGDPEAARTIFENVLMNAVEAMEGRGELRVAIVPTAARVEIEIRDRGPGIPPTDLGRVFDPFFSTKGMGRGIGLGLAIVRDLAVDMAWEVAVSSTPGEGTAFRISAPRFRSGNSAS